MKLYLAGPMTGYKDHNYPLFFRAAAATLLGWSESLLRGEEL